MRADLTDLNAFLIVARAGGFREGARTADLSASALSGAIRRLEDKTGVRLFHRSTRSVTLTEAGTRLLERLSPALDEIEASLALLEGFRDRPSGKLRLNVPVSAAKLILPNILPGFMVAYPEIQLEIFAQDDLVDVLSSGFDAGIRYGERLEQDMIAVPIGPRLQRLATAATPAYLDAHGRPDHPRELLNHKCLRGRFASAAPMPWEFERGGEIVRIDPPGQLLVGLGSAAELSVQMAIAGQGVVHIFEDWLRPYLDAGTLEPILHDWWQSFTGPFLYFSGRRLLPPALRAFLDFIKHSQS